MTAPAPLVYPLAGLLAEPLGTDRRYEIARRDDRRSRTTCGSSSRSTARCESSRTNRGVLVDAKITTAIAGTCVRCLRDIEIPMTVEIHEEALPSVDLASGKPVDPADGAGRRRGSPTTTSWTSGRSPARRSRSRSRSPRCARRPVPGLCSECGERLGPDHAEHEVDEIDPRMAALQGFRVDGDGESG